MLQRFSNPKGFSLTAADTNRHTMPDEPAAMVYVCTPSTNVGAITIRDAGGSGVGGLPIPAGAGISSPVVVLGPILRLSALEFQLAHAGDVLNLLVLR